MRFVNQSFQIYIFQILVLIVLIVNSMAKSVKSWAQLSSKVIYSIKVIQSHVTKRRVFEEEERFYFI